MLRLKSFEDVWGYVQKQMKVATAPKGGTWWHELIHGGRHTRNVLAEAKAITERCNLGPIGANLMISAAIHDLGRLGQFPYEGLSEEHITAYVARARIDTKNLSYIDHAHLSANLLESDIFAFDDKPDVVWAIRNHSVGLVGLGIKKAQRSCEILLGLLVVCDHCGDAACPEGMSRAARDLLQRGTSMRSKKFEKEHLISFLEPGCPVIPVAKAKEYKDESLTAHLVYNFQATWPIINCVRHILGEDYIQEEIMPYMEMFKSIILSFLKD